MNKNMQNLIASLDAVFSALNKVESELPEWHEIADCYKAKAKLLCELNYLHSTMVDKVNEYIQEEVER